MTKLLPAARKRINLSAKRDRIGETFATSHEIPWRIPRVGADMLADMSDTDLELLARYTRQHAEDAFAEIVRRHLGLVYSAALRQVRSPQLAEEVAQSAFIDLARSAARLKPDTILTAWLYQVTRRTAIDVVRREASRQLREQIATEMNAMNATAADWTHIEPLLDEAMHALDDTDRTAVLLRYFENKSLREVGATLGTSENAAQKRLGRAVERLRELLTKRGVTAAGASGLIVLISANAVQAAPAGLAASVAQVSIAGASAATAGFLAKLTDIFLTAKGALLAGGVVTAVVIAFLAVNPGNGQSPTSKNLASATTNNFQPLMLTRFYNRLFSNPYPADGWELVPRGIVEFEGVPFRMYGKINLTGLGPVRDEVFDPARVGELPVGQRASRLHLIHGARYNDPDDTPLACLLLHYENGEDRKLFIRYGVHVRNWYVEATERNSSLRDPRTTIVWNGMNSTNLNVKPTRLFKTTFDNPLPAQTIRSIELLSLFARASSIIVAITLEPSAGNTLPPTPAATDEVDDTPYRREMLVRTLDKTTGKIISNAVLNVTVSEQPREFRFGSYHPDAHGQILLDYPPGKFPILNLRVTASGYFPASDVQMNDEGIFPAEVVLRLNPAPRIVITNAPNTNLPPSRPAAPSGTATPP